MKRLTVILLSATSICVASRAAADPPNSMLDFDREVSFSQPLYVSAFHGLNDDQIYYILPNSLELAAGKGGVPRLSLVYENVKHRRHALLSVKGTVTYGRDYQAAVAEIKARDAKARFAFPQPYAFQFRMMTPSSDSQGATIEAAKINSAGEFELLARVSDVTSRILLLPNSYKFDFMSVIYAPTYRGIVRDEDGTIKIKDRSFEIGVVSNGGCVFNPDQYVGWLSNSSGCIFPAYDGHLVRKIQTKLLGLGLLKSKVDGICGPQTREAIREFQKSKSLPEDGIPTPDLLVL